MSLWPKEHGAYGQIGMPLATALAVCGVSMSAALLAVSVVAVFLAHEPLLVLLGRRGGRAARDLRGRAVAWLAVTAGAASVASVVAYALMPDVARTALLWPLAPAIVVGMTIRAGREKSAMGETAVALAFSLFALPVGLAAGAAHETALPVALVFASVFVTCTLAVRGIVLSARGGGQPRATQHTRIAAVVLTVAALIGLAWAASRALLPSVTLAAAAPGLAAAAWLTVRPPPPTQLRRVGWTLVVVSVAAALVLIVNRIVG
jgi:hypothetical protein